MSSPNHLRRYPEVGKVAARLLTIPVMSLALLACYVLLRAAPDESALMAEAAPAFAGVPHEGDALSADRVVPLEPQRVDDAPIAAYEALDPVGAGRDAAR